MSCGFGCWVELRKPGNPEWLGRDETQDGTSLYRGHRPEADAQGLVPPRGFVGRSGEEKGGEDEER